MPNCFYHIIIKLNLIEYTAAAISRWINLESGCRYLNCGQVCPLFIFNFYFLLQALAAHSDWTFSEAFLLLSLFFVAFKSFTYVLYRMLSLKPMSVVFLNAFIQCLKCLKNKTFPFEKKKCLCAFWTIRNIHISLHQVQSLSPYFLYFL